VLAVIFLALIIPSFAVMARRLHDMGQTGAWLLLSLIGLGIVPFIMAFFESQPWTNRYGADPRVA
jgi:uncharacterized membrane protein YhaH (DUF805 family)